MKRSEVEVLFSPEAQREFDDIQRNSHPLMKEWARRYLEDLIHFPPEDWVDLHSRLGGDVFKADSHIPLDIQGKTFRGRGEMVESVLVTRFRLK